MIEVYQLTGILAFVDTVCEKLWHRDSCFKVGGIISWDDVVSTIGDEGDSPHVGCEVSPSAEDGFTVEGDLAAMGVKENLTTCITED